MRVLKQTALSILLFMAVAFAQAGTDWPQFQRNAAHTGWTPDSPAPPYEFAYVLDFNPEIIGAVQPVIGAGTMYVPTKQGRLYAFDAASGEKLWVTEGLGIVIRSAAAADGLVYVANVEGAVHAVKAGTGEKVWRRDMGFGCTAGPCLANGRVFLGSRRGDFFCLSGADGGVIWQTRLPHYIWTTAAVADGKVFIGTDGEIHMYCLAEADGGTVWVSEKLAGLFMRDGAPVATGGKVFVRTVPAEFIGDSFGALPYEYWGLSTPPEKVAEYFAQLRKGELPADFETANEGVIEAYRLRPLIQTMFAFDVQTGKQPYIPVHFHVLAPWYGPCMPPAVDSRGMLQVPVAFALSRFGRMDPDTGRIIQILVGPDNEKFSGTRNPDGFGTSSDENHATSCGGDRVYWKHMKMNNSDTSMIYDLRTREAVNIMQIEKDPISPNVRGEKAPVYRVSDQAPGAAALARRWGIGDNSYAGHNTAMAIWGKHMFWQSANMVWAIVGRGESIEGDEK